MTDFLSVIPSTPETQLVAFGGEAAREIGADLTKDGEAISLHLPNGINAGIRFGADGTVIVVSRTPILATSPINPGEDKCNQFAFRISWPPPPERESVTITPGDVGDVPDVLGSQERFRREHECDPVDPDERAGLART